MMTLALPTTGPANPWWYVGVGLLGLGICIIWIVIGIRESRRKDDD